MMEYEKLTVVKLKEELKNRGIPITNLKVKQNFIDRLVQDDEEKAESQPAAEAEDVKDEVKEQQQEEEEEAAPADESEDAVPQETSEVAKEPSPQAEQPAPTQVVETEESVAEESKEPNAPQVIEQPRPSSPVKEEPTQHVQSEAPQSAADSNAMDVDTEPVPRASTTPAVVASEPTSAEGKKRKRRSVTPQVSEEVVSKKLKHADDPVVHLEKEDEKNEKDAIMPDVPLDDAQTTVQPMATSDDVVDVTMKDQDKHTISRATRSPNERRFKNLINPTEPDPASLAVDDSMDVTVSPALHPATAAVYIRDLVRPINPSGLRDHVEDLARPPDQSSDADSPLIKDFWVDALRTHAFFLFSSISAASRVRAGLHARVWPPEPTRRPLWADFFPEERFSEWVEQERASGGSRPSQAKRWEVSYDITDDNVDVHLVEAGPSTHRPSIQAANSGPAPNIPTGPRGSMSGGRRPSFQQPGLHRRPSQPTPRRPSPRAVEEASAPFLELDKLFRFTTTKPKLYWQPVSENLADDRLDELDRETSRDWDARRDARENGDSLGRGLDQLKRYTFEDGDVIVDGGPEFGGGRAFARNGGGRGRGRRGGDSFRR